MKKILLISIVSAVVVGIVALMLLINNPKSEVKEQVEVKDTVTLNQDQNVSDNPVSGTETMKALLSKGEDLECNITYKSDISTTTPTSGSFFTSQGRMRGDFIVPTLQEEVLSSMIMDSQNMYTWTVVDGQKFGMKISLTELEKSKLTDDSPEAHEPVPLDVSVDYECKPWKPVDASIFVPPSDVIFKDYNDLINTGMEFGNIYEEQEAISLEGKSPCQLCEQVDGPGKEECKIAFSCQ